MADVPYKTKFILHSVMATTPYYNMPRILRVVILLKLNKSHVFTCRKTYRTAPTMMLISDGHHDDISASTANRNNSTPAKTPHTSKTKKNLAKTQRTKLFPLKFEYNVSSSNVQITQLHGQVLKALFTRFGDDITVYDKEGDREIKMVTFPRTKELWDVAFHMQKVTNARKNEKAIIMVGHHIATPLSLSDIKQGIHDTLCRVNGFIKINDWGIHLDSRSAGFLANLQPVHHNRELIQSDIAKFLNNSMCEDADTSPMSDFKVVPSSANESQSNKRVSSRFLAITCKNSEEALSLRKKLVAAYSTLPTPKDPSLDSSYQRTSSTVTKKSFAN
jgi:hypothetical protein